jgi:hypothetical protein
MVTYKGWYNLSITVLLLSAVLNNAVAQKTVNDLVNAEKNFAAYSAQFNARDAFMLFLDSANGVEFNNGEAKKSYDIWSKRTPDSSKLLWQPAFAGISSSGELGFTTGPWQYKKSANTPAIAAGQFATIWHYTGKGGWKFLVDIGTNFNLPAYNVDTVTKWTGSYSTIEADDPLMIDRRFIQQYNTLHNDAYKNIIAGDAWFVIDGMQPFMGAQSVLAGIHYLPANLQFIEVGGGASSAGDLVYVYGTVRHDDKITNYLRVWQKTAKGYILKLQVM